ncbi:MAG: FemAB family PEP-CTERM system-associated protein [Pseudomonadales bacterium]
MNGLAVRQATDVDSPRWDEFVRRFNRASFYHRYGWMRVISQAFGHDVYPLLCEDERDVQGVLPLVLIESRLFGRIMCSMPFLNYGGPVATSDAAESLLIESARRLARELNVDFLELRSRHKLPIEGIQPSTHKVSMTIDLDSDPERLWTAFSSKHRTSVRRAYKNELRVEKGGPELLEDYYRLMALSWRSLGTPFYSRSFFGHVLDEFQDSIEIFLCLHGNQPIAVAMNGVHEGTVEGMWAGAEPAGRHLQYSYVLYWEMVKDACLQGRKSFHLGRSSADSGGEVFKKKWNAVPEQLYWYYDLVKRDRMPNLNTGNPRFSGAIELWKKLPLFATRTIGPIIAKSIP